MICVDLSKDFDLTIPWLVSSAGDKWKQKKKKKKKNLYQQFQIFIAIIEFTTKVVFELNPQAWYWSSGSWGSPWPTILRKFGKIFLCKNCSK